MTKEKMTIYKLLKPILGLLYKAWYNPKILGSDNIKKTDAILLVGNHIHIMDQCNIIISTKRPIHYMAKQEYFQGKTAWFFKSVGCIPVDRSKKDKEATAKALEVVENNRALGLFPEGTRNILKIEKIKEIYEKYHLTLSLDSFIKKMKQVKTSQFNYLEKLVEEEKVTKEDFYNNLYNIDFFLKELVKANCISKDDYLDSLLLPFKFGSVSMASKTASYLVPYAITGTYKFRSKDLTIRIGKPFKVETDLETANEKLRTEIKKLIEKNLQNNGK